MKKILVLLVIIIPTMALLYFSLTRDPRALPSTLVGKAAPTFSLETLDGKTVSLTSERGTALIVGFWATWCGPCLGEHRLIQQFQKPAEAAGIQFYSILYEDTPDNARAFIKRYGKAAPILVDPKLATAINYGVAGVPETFFIDRQGVILYKHAGVLTADLLFEKMKQLTEAEGS